MKGFSKEYSLTVLGSKILVNTNVFDNGRVYESSKYKIENTAEALESIKALQESLGYKLNKSYSNVV